MRWSNSMLYTMQQCGERFRRRYVDRDFRPSGIKAKRGIAVHRVSKEAHSRQLRGKIEKRERYRFDVPTIQEAQDLAAESFDNAVAEGVAYTSEEREFGEAKVRGIEKDHAVQMAGFYVEQPAPTIDPLGVEERIIIRPAGSDDEIQGIVDLVAEEVFSEPATDGVMVNEVVHDLKTADRSPREGAAESSQQLKLYALLRTAVRGGTPPDRVRLNTLVRTRTGKTSFVVQSATPTAEDLQAVANRLNSAMEAVRRGLFVPANPDSWWCSARYCEYYSDCPFALGRAQG